MFHTLETVGLFAQLFFFLLGPHPEMTDIKLKTVIDQTV